MHLHMRHSQEARWNPELLYLRLEYPLLAEDEESGHQIDQKRANVPELVLFAR